MRTGMPGDGAGLAPLRRRFGPSLRGASLKDLVSIATHLGLAARPLRLEPEELALLATPCILHWDQNHFVVLKAVTATGVVIHDPAVGVRRLARAEVNRHFTGVALELTPAPGFTAAEPGPRLRVTALLGRVVGVRRSLALLAVMALAIETLGVTSPFFMQWVVDEALVGADRDLLATLAWALCFMLLLRVAITTMRGATLIAISSVMKVSGRAALFGHLVRLPARYFESRHLGDVMSRFGSQETILQALTTDLVEILLDGLMSVVTLIVMLLYAPALAGVVLAGALLYAGVRVLSYSSLRNARAEAIVWSARRDSHFLETLRGMKTIKLFNGQDGRQAHWVNLLVETVNRQVTAQKLGLMFRTVNSTLIGIVAVLVLWLGAERVLQNAFSVGMLLAFISYKDQFLSRVSSLIDKGLDLVMLRLHAERLADIALTAPEERGLPAAGPLRRAPLGLDLRELRFRLARWSRGYWMASTCRSPRANRLPSSAPPVAARRPCCACWPACSTRVVAKCWSTAALWRPQGSNNTVPASASCCRTTSCSPARSPTISASSPTPRARKPSAPARARPPSSTTSWPCRWASTP